MSNKNRPSPTGDAAADLVGELTWQLLDDTLDEEGLEQLSLVLENSELARKTYLETVQMHVGLLDLHGRLPSAKSVLAKAESKGAAPLPLSAGDIPTIEPTGV